MAGLDEKLKESVADVKALSHVAVNRRQKEKRWWSWSRHRRVIKSSQRCRHMTSSSDAGVASPPKAMRTRGTKSVLSPDLVGALDRTGVSSRRALRIVAATASSLGHDPQELVLNPESIRQARAKYRFHFGEGHQRDFQSSLPFIGTGRSFLRTMALAPKDRHLVTGEGVEKLLGVPKTALRNW
ncbi:hypothetical protein GWK47_004905 [Chionoecetes opilio]|uniref:Uncharacterized protein n=1 Tax=Chionoecetes opilio TaxID=41210 RepID=A0A8J4YK72_CHIOP|nr:hypothetical protein GWK47_004905 [Chionoecetes opilio]